MYNVCLLISKQTNCQPHQCRREEKEKCVKGQVNAARTVAAPHKCHYLDISVLL